MSPLPPVPHVTPRARPRRASDLVEPARIDRLDDAALDELPFGVICLAGDGLILRYNVAEGRLARLDPNTVVGRNFFTDVAPCTYTEDFYGRFKAFVDGRLTAASARFTYVFDFKFGAQEVEVELLRVPDAARYYLLIDRTRFLERRVGPEAREPAPRQSELAIDEAGQGILRNAYAGRVVAAPAALFETLASALEASEPERWAELCHAWGLRAGRRLVIELETSGSDDRPLRARPMREVVELVSDLLREQGWGRIVFDLGASAQGVLRLEIESSALVGRPTRLGRSCHLLAGMLEAVLNHLAQRRLHVEELRCASSSGTCCEMIVVGESRRELVTRLAAQRVGTDEVLARLEASDDERTA